MKFTTLEDVVDFYLTSIKDYGYGGDAEFSHPLFSIYAERLGKSIDEMKEYMVDGIESVDSIEEDLNWYLEDDPFIIRLIKDIIGYKPTIKNIVREEICDEQYRNIFKISMDKEDDVYVGVFGTGTSYGNVVIDVVSILEPYEKVVIDYNTKKDYYNIQ